MCHAVHECPGAEPRNIVSWLLLVMDITRSEMRPAGNRLDGHEACFCVYRSCHQRVGRGRSTGGSYVGGGSHRGPSRAMRASVRTGQTPMSALATMVCRAPLSWSDRLPCRRAPLPCSPSGKRGPLSISAGLLVGTAELAFRWRALFALRRDHARRGGGWSRSAAMKSSRSVGQSGRGVWSEARSLIATHKRCRVARSRGFLPRAELLLRGVLGECGGGEPSEKSAVKAVFACV